MNKKHRKDAEIEHESCQLCNNSNWIKLSFKDVKWNQYYKLGTYYF